MRFALPVLLAACLLTTGCIHRPGETTATAQPAAGSPGAVLQERAGRSRSLNLYVDQASPGGAGLAQAGPLALALRDLLRARGFDVRSAETTPPNGEPGALASQLAAAIAAGEPAPAAARPLSYLQPNAPRLLFFVHLGTAADARNGAPTLGAFLADSADGTILWSARATSRSQPTDLQLRQLAERLLKTLPALTPR
jgi:hypothetical protein